MVFSGGGEDQNLETLSLPVLERAHVRDSPRLRSRDLGGITDEEGSILVEQPQERLLEGSLLQEPVDHLVASEESLGDGPGNLGDPGGTGL